MDKIVAFYPVLLPVGCISCTSVPGANIPEKPNIIIIMADDLGYGDLSCYGAKNIPTPHIDSLATNGLLFTDGHCAAATSSPSRYSLLTGRYAFRNKLSILPGDASLMISPGTETLPSLLKRAGYTTAVVGKWHLGLGRGSINWNDSIQPGPLEIGFDYSFIIPATGDRVPCVFVENYTVVNAQKEDPIQVSYSEPLEGYPDGLTHPELLRMKADTQHSNTIVNGISRIGYMSGGKKALWKDEDFAELLPEKSIRFIEENRTRPFFLYLAYHDIHVPRIVHDNFKGKSSMGPRGDAILQMDYCTGRIVQVLRKLGLEKNTILIFTSDNGPVLTDGYGDEALERAGDHTPAGIFRGGKYSAYEAGTRIPFIVSWPGVITPGISNALVSHTDFLASFASLLSLDYNQNSATDSEDQMDVFLGRSEKGRTHLIEESMVLSLRKEHWKYIPAANYRRMFDGNKNIELGVDTIPQLYDLKNDPEERNNLAHKNAKLAGEMKNSLEKIVKKEE